MASRTALISILVLVSAVFLSRAYPKEESKELLNVEDVLLEDALFKTDIPESAVEDYLMPAKIFVYGPR
ncbi:unnamed protein product [Schistocephalus solidus]|uniref:Venom peptide n=1 Tax=Schistocephalus solidus TaxID=70667 RepID=A0A183T439_SCHSO|nr:unnamed protein product [Schistocephalus solidus]